MEEKEIQVAPEEELDGDDDIAETNALAKALQELKGQESDDDDEPEDEKPEGENDDEPAKEEPAKEEPAEDIEARVNALLEAKLQEQLDKVKREASEGAYNAAMAKFKKQEESAARKLKEYETKFGKPLDAIVAEYTGQQVKTLMDEGYDEATARRIVDAESKTREYEAREKERQFEHLMFQAKAKFTNDLTAFISDPNTDASVKKVTVKYQKDIEDFMNEGLEGGRIMDFDVVRDLILGRHLPELLKEQQAELERIKSATEQKVLKNVQERGKAKVESASTAVPSTPTVSKAERAFLRKLGMDDNDIADIAKKRAAKKK